MLFQRIAALFAAVTVLLLAGQAQAIPAFARRYETSCQTCHVAYPKLTPFGEAFRRNAYRFPGGGDATAEKEEPLALGNDAMKDRFPAAVWPGQIARQLPLSMLIDGKLTYGPSPEGHVDGAAMAGMTEDAHGGGHAESALALGGLGGQIGLRAGGTLGDIGGYFGSVNIGGHEPIAVERAFAVLTPAGPTALHMRVGRFEPELHGVSVHRGIFNHQLRLTTNTVQLNGFSPEMSSTGLELSGVALGRAAWALGVVETVPAGTSVRKNFYGRLEYKLGGMRLDGIDASAGAAAWSERSLQLGFSAWSGRSGLLAANGMPIHDDDFLRIGVDLHGTFDDLMLDVVGVRQSHSQPTATAGTKMTMDMLFAELTYMVNAVVVPTIRFEGTSLDYGEGKPDQRYLTSLQGTWILRPNVLLRADVGVGADPGSHAEFRAVSAGFSAAF
ncbi:MAG: hypothetical protein HY902_05830 [Deltaproteobacteria bacterium]|nr:hypothetical protein [Deltaproteobacteria bacterium]